MMTVSSTSQSATALRALTPAMLGAARAAAHLADDALPPALPYTTEREVLADHLERVRLMLARHIVRRWYRQTDSTGRLSDLFVSLEEVRRTLSGAGANAAALCEPPDASGLPDLDAIELELEVHTEMMHERLAASGDALGMPALEELRGLLHLEDTQLDALVLLYALQSNIDLHRLASFAWADFARKLPTLGFLAEVVGAEGSPDDAVLRLAEPGHIVQRLALLELLPDEHHGEQTPRLFLRARLPARLSAFLEGEGTLDTPAALHGQLGATSWDDLDLYCALHAEPRSLESIGQPDSYRIVYKQLRRHACELADCAERSPRRHALGARWEPLAQRAPVVLLSGVEEARAELAHACLGGAMPLLEIRLAQGVDRALARGQSLREALDQRLAVALREALLVGAVPLLALDGLLDSAATTEALLDALHRLLPLVRTEVLLGVESASPALRRALGPCAELPVPTPAPEQRAALWARAIEALGATPPEPRELDDVGNRYGLNAGAIEQLARCAVHGVRGSATHVPAGGPRPGVSVHDLHRAVRQRLEHSLGDLAEPLTTSLSLDELVLPAKLRDQLDEMIQCGRHARTVYGAWGLGRLVPYGRGLTALFAGPPGTGKTQSAAILARELGCEAFRIDLSRIVDKYIGETEKRLARVFDEAERSGALLLFDEADALFAKRTEVKSSNDRYANLEVGYLLQRIEHFEGATILTTNLGDEIDAAFRRRIRFHLEFELPDLEARAALWRRMLPPTAPLADDLDFELLGEAFELSPGHIRNAVMRAAFAAARAGQPIGQRTLLDAARAECRALGHLVRDLS